MNAFSSVAPTYPLMPRQMVQYVQVTTTLVPRQFRLRAIWAKCRILVAAVEPSHLGPTHALRCESFSDFVRHCAGCGCGAALVDAGPRLDGRPDAAVQHVLPLPDDLGRDRDGASAEVAALPYERPSLMCLLSEADLKTFAGLPRGQ